MGTWPRVPPGSDQAATEPRRRRPRSARRRRTPPGRSGSTSRPASPTVSGSAPAARGHDRDAARHRLQAGQPEPLVARGHHQRARAGVQAGQMLLGDVAEPAQRESRRRVGSRGRSRPAPARCPARAAPAPPARARPGSCAPTPSRRRARTGGSSHGARAPASESTPEAKRSSDAFRDHPDRSADTPRSVDQLAARELRDGDQQARPRGEQRQDPALVGDVRAGVRLRVAERGRVVDHDDVAPARAPVRGWPASRSARNPWSAAAAPACSQSVAGAVRERRGRAHHAVAIGPQCGQPKRHLARESLDAADFRSHRRAGVDRNQRPPVRLSGRH